MSNEQTIQAMGWGQVIDQVVRHPYRSGGSMLAFGAACAGIGVLHKDAQMFSLGVGAGSLAGCQLMGFVQGCRMPRFALQ